MDNRATVNELFSAIADSLGFQVVLGNNNLCNIRLKSTGKEYIVELPHSGETLHLYAALTDLPFDYREKVFEYALKLNLHGIETSCAAIAIDERSHKFILSRTISVEGLTDTLLLKVISEFFASVPKIEEKLTQFSQFCAQDTASAPGSFGPANLLML
ncbi:MAG: CesT family type III secretion system chaperone [Verrucomicrobiota bacterium]|nr:MAG: CesT family type III secretion system chaperone [Verrucomicrobiota bacterium]